MNNPPWKKPTTIVEVGDTKVDTTTGEIIDTIPELEIDGIDELSPLLNELHEEALAEEQQTEDVVIDDQDDNAIEYCRLYKADKFAPYQIVSDEEALNILDDNLHNVVKRFSKESVPGANDQDAMAEQYISSRENDTYNLNYFQEDNSVRSVRTGFLSMWKYNKKELQTWMDSHAGKVEGFRGSSTNNQASVSTDYYYFDFDHSGGMIETLRKIQPLLEDLSASNVRYRLFSSGSKGFHIYIHKSYFSIPDKHKDDPHYVINKYIARHLQEKYKMYVVEKDKLPSAHSESTAPASMASVNKMIKKSFVDISIYNPVNALRMPFSRNEKTDFMKREFFYHPINDVVRFSQSSLSPKKIEDVSIEDCLIYVPNNLSLFRSLFSTLLSPPDEIVNNTDIWLHMSEDMFVYNISKGSDESSVGLTTTQSTFDKYNHPMYGKVCMYNMLNDPAPAERRNTALRLMSWWKDMKYKPRIVHAMLQAWNAELDNPCTKSEISKVMNAWKLDYVVCKDHIALQYCPMNNSCVFNKIRTLRDDSYVDSAGALQQYQDFEALDKTSIVSLGDIYKGNTIVMYPKEISAVVAGSGVGKSVIVTDVLLKSSMPYYVGNNLVNDDYFNVLLSNEMNVRQVVRRLSLHLGLDMSDPNDAKAFVTATKNLIIIQDNTPIQLLRDKLLAIQDRMKKKLKLVGLDYFGIQRCYYPGSTKLITDGVTRADVMADVLPEMVREIDAHLLFCAQPTKAVQGGGTVPLTEESMKNGQAVQALAGQIWAAWRPLKGVQSADNIMSMQVVKNRDGEQTAYLDYHWHGSSYTIGDPLTMPYKHKDAIIPKEG